MGKITKAYADTPWSNDGETLSDAHGNDLFVADDEQDRGTLALFDAAPDLVEALISSARQHAFDSKNYLLGPTKAVEYADQHWPKHLTTKGRAALTKAGIIE